MTEGIVQSKSGLVTAMHGRNHVSIMSFKPETQLLTPSAIAEVKETFEKYVHNAPQDGGRRALVLDMHDVTDAKSDFIEALLHLRFEMEKRGDTLVIANPQEYVSSLLKTTHVDRTIRIYRDMPLDDVARAVSPKPGPVIAGDLASPAQTAKSGPPQKITR